MKLNRRDFIKALSIGLAGGYLGIKTKDSIADGKGGGCGGCGCGGGTSIDPPPGAAFTDPAILDNESAESGVVEVSLEAKVTPINVNGTIANLLTYNDYYPGPTIKV